MTVLTVSSNVAVVLMSVPNGHDNPMMRTSRVHGSKSRLTER